MNGLSCPDFFTAPSEGKQPMRRSRAGLLAFAAIFLVLLAGGVAPFTAVWSFPGNFEALRAFPSQALPLGAIPLMVVVLVGTGVYMTLRLGFPQI